jgi:hypothetical protein
MTDGVHDQAQVAYALHPVAMDEDAHGTIFDLEESGIDFPQAPLYHQGESR